MIEVISACADPRFLRYEQAGDTALITACMYGRAALVDILLEHGADVNVTNHVSRWLLISNRAEHDVRWFSIALRNDNETK